MTDWEETAVLVLSCDKYALVAKQCVSILHKKWQDCPTDIYVVTETSCVDGANNINVRNSCWSNRLIECLKQIKQRFLLIILDDFWIEEPVNTSLVEEYIRQIRSNPKIANIGFSAMPGQNFKKIIVDCSLRSRKPWSLLNYQIGLWRKENLLLILKAGENPWQSEIFGSIRARLFPWMEFYCLKNDSTSPFVYNKGWLIVRGKWNMKEAKRIEQKIGIKIDYGDMPQEDSIEHIKMKFSMRLKIHIDVLLQKFIVLFRRKKGFCEK